MEFRESSHFRVGDADLSTWTILRVLVHVEGRNKKMTYLKSWEEFEKAAEKLYLQDPMKVRYSMKYTHNKGALSLKLTDNIDCLQYKTEIVQDLKKVEKFINNLMRHMASKEQ